MLFGGSSLPKLDFRRLPGPVLILPSSSFGGMSAGSFSRTAAGNRAYSLPRSVTNGCSAVLLVVNLAFWWVYLICRLITYVYVF